MWSGDERREKTWISPEIVEEIAEKAAEKAVEKMKAQFYTEIGKSVMNKFYWAIGVVIIGLAVVLTSKGYK